MEFGYVCMPHIPLQTGRNGYHGVWESPSSACCEMFAFVLIRHRDRVEQIMKGRRRSCSNSAVIRYDVQATLKADGYRPHPPAPRPRPRPLPTINFEQPHLTNIVCASSLFWYTQPKVHGDAKGICRKRGPACLRDG